MPVFDKTSRPCNEYVYTFRSKPRSLKVRPKYQLDNPESEGQVMYGNIMYDRRVIRGNTYLPSLLLPFSEQPDPIKNQCEQESKWKAMAKARSRKQFCGHRTPAPVEGRQHIEVQTELYLEAITDRVEEADIDTQTDLMLDRPPAPLFVPATTSKDVATQIKKDDLFDFNREVKPVLEVMVGKTLKQSMIEVLEEEELANLRYQQCEFEEVRNAELNEKRRLEEQELRLREEKERRMEQQKDVLRKERETADKIAAHAFASSFLLDLKPDVFRCLYKKGYFFDRVERDIEVDFLPFTIEAGVLEVHNKIVARKILDCLIREVCLTRLDDFSSVPVSPPPTPPVKLPKIVPEKPVIPEPVPYKCEVEEYDYEYTYDGSC